MKLKNQLLANLDSQGFSHHQLAQLEESCANWLIASRKQSDGNNTKVLIHSILNFCYQVKERIDAIAPVTPEIHNKIEQVIVAPLKEAINEIENGGAQEHLDVIANLIDADVEMRKVSEPA